MNRKILFILPLALIVAACGTPGGKKPYKQYQGINYDLYAKTGPGTQGTVDQTNINAPDFNIDIDVDGNEVIESTGRNFGEAVVVMAVRKIQLSPRAAQRDVLVFQTALDNAYRAVMRGHRPSGFTYTMSPAGAVNPLSVMDVQCILAESSANAAGRDACDLFFREAAEQFLNLRGEAN